MVSVMQFDQKYKLPKVKKVSEAALKKAEQTKKKGRLEAETFGN